MHKITAYFGEHKIQFLFLLLIAFVYGIGLIDHTTALAGGILLETVPTDLKGLMDLQEKAFKAMQENIKKVQDIATNALEETRKEGTLHKETNDKLTALGTTGQELSENIKELRTRMVEVEQKAAHRPAAGGDTPKSMGQIVSASDQYQGAQKRYKGGAKTPMDAVNVGSFHQKASIFGTGNQVAVTQSAIVAPDFRPGIIMPGLQRMTVRDLLAQNTTQSNLIVFAKENVFTSNAGPQYDASPGSTEGALKNESAITFTLSNTPVVTLAHWLPASEQILDDAPMLQGYVDGRLRYGLMLEEEHELLTGDGTAGTLTGLNNSATAFAGGATNQSALDTILKAFLQIRLSFFEPTGVVMHPTDWTNLMLLKDTLGRYLFSDPQGTTQPRLWGKDVVATPSQTLGQFTAGAFLLAAEIYDRQDATVEISKEHADFFIRNMVAILCEERLALAIYRSAAIVKGSISNIG